MSIRAIWPLPIVLLLGCGGVEPETTTGDCRPPPTTCTGESCIGDPWSIGQFGDPCHEGVECESNLCGQDTATGAQFCTKTCDPNDLVPCPYSAQCLLTGDAMGNVCGPPVDCQ